MGIRLPGALLYVEFAPIHSARDLNTNPLDSAI
jgi:hypothetical protein